VTFDFDLQFKGLFKLTTQQKLKPGDSGGPVFNKDGEVIGIVKADKKDEGSIYAIPINLAANLIDMVESSTIQSELVKQLSEKVVNFKKEIKEQKAALDWLKGDLNWSAKLKYFDVSDPKTKKRVATAVLSISYSPKYEGQKGPGKIVKIRVYPIISSPETDIDTVAEEIYVHDDLDFSSGKEYSIDKFDTKLEKKLGDKELDVKLSDIKKLKIHVRPPRPPKGVAETPFSEKWFTEEVQMK
jgi:hypothetical protein